METLPNELLSEIFLFLHPVYDELARFSVVCRRWNEIIHRTPSLWEHMHLKLEKLTKAEKSIVFRCLRKFNKFIKCLRVPSLDVAFGCDFWFFIRLVTLEMRNITCLDVPTLPWSIEQFVALKSAENLKELTLYGFWDLSDMEWIQRYYHPVSLINLGHLQLLKERCRKLEVLKLSINMMRISDSRALIESLNALKLKELQISAYNSSKANIQMNQSGIKVLKCLLSSHHGLIISKMELQYVSIGHKELRLLLRKLASLRWLKVSFADVHRCMTGYQYLESKSLKSFELHNLPAKNIVNLKCSMPKLRRLQVTTCSSLRSLQVISPLLQHLFLETLLKLRSLHVTSTTIKLLEVVNCESLTSNVVDAILQRNKKAQFYVIRGHLEGFQLFKTGVSCSLTRLSVWLTYDCTVECIQVHCPSLEYFCCIDCDTLGESLIPTQGLTCVDLRCSNLGSASISLPRVGSINVKCKTIGEIVLNEGERKSFEMPCSVVRVEAEDQLRTFCVNKCIFNRVEIKAGKIDNLNFQGCRIKGVLKLEGGLIDELCMRKLMETQINVDLILRCDEMNKFILQECRSLSIVSIFPDEIHLLKSLVKITSDSYVVPDANYSYEESQKLKGQGIFSNVMSPIKMISTSNCPRFTGLRLYHTKGTPSEIQDSVFLQCLWNS